MQITFDRYITLPVLLIISESWMLDYEQLMWLLKLDSLFRKDEGKNIACVC